MPELTVAVCFCAWLCFLFLQHCFLTAAPVIKLLKLFFLTRFCLVYLNLLSCSALSSQGHRRIPFVVSETFSPCSRHFTDDRFYDLPVIFRFSLKNVTTSTIRIIEDLTTVIYCVQMSHKRGERVVTTVNSKATLLLVIFVGEVVVFVHCHAQALIPAQRCLCDLSSGKTGLCSVTACFSKRFSDRGSGTA